MSQMQGGGPDGVPSVRACSRLEVRIPSDVQALRRLCRPALERWIDVDSHGAVVGSVVAGSELDGQAIVGADAAKGEPVADFHESSERDYRNGVNDWQLIFSPIRCARPDTVHQAIPCCLVSGND